MASKLLKAANALQPLWWLVVRLWIWSVFFNSGLTKIDDFESTVILFRDEYKTPFLPPYIAALSGTFFELTCSCLIAIGLATRLAALPLLAMTAVIQFTYLEHVEHIYWAFLLSGLALHGAGKWSADAWIMKRYQPLLWR
ncbi:MAG: DoxX family protein [Proteobacteria bacterium]|nr:DoxX family protein [Pseudomonadota bacterium]